MDDELFKELGARAKIVVLGQPSKEIASGLEYIPRPLQYDKFIGRVSQLLNEKN